MSVQIRIIDVRGGYDLPHMEKREAHETMRNQYLAKGSVEDVLIKDCHSKGVVIDDDGYMQLNMRDPMSMDNPLQIDTSWGAHIEANDTEVSSAMYQSSRELRIATTVLDDRSFYKLLQNHPSITSVLAVTRKLDYMPEFHSTRILNDGSEWVEPCEMTLYVSYFSGKFKQIPSEGGGLRYYSIDGIKDAIHKNPNQFTHDLRYIVNHYSHLLVAYDNLDAFKRNPDTNANELVQCFSLDGHILSPMNRKLVHQGMIESFNSGQESPSKHKHVRVMLRTPAGDYYLSKRSKFKKENPGLVDKPVAGHVRLNDTYETAVINECYDELLIPAAVVTEDDMRSIVKFRPEMLKNQAVLTRIATWESYTSKDRTLKDGGKWDELCDTAIYFGYYNGPIEFKDGESKGINVSSLAELKSELEENPEGYTHDLVDLVKLIEKRGLGD